MRSRGLVSGLLSLAVACALAGAEEKEEKIRLPESPDAAVLTLDFRAGLGPPRIDEPILTVLADGRVLAPDVWHDHGTATGRLEAGDLAALLRFVVAEQRFFAFDAKDVRKRVRESPGGSPPPPDSGVTIVTVTLADRSAKVEYPALDLAAAALPEIAELGRLKAVVDRLDRLRVVTTAGGPKAVTRYLALVNEALRARDEEAEPFDREDLDDAFLLGEGARKVRFARIREERRLQATVVDAGGEDPPEVTFHES